MNLKTKYCSFTSAQPFMDSRWQVQRRPLCSFEEATQEKGFISCYICPSIPKLFFLARLGPVKTRWVQGSFPLLRLSPIQPAGYKEETSDAFCYRLLTQIWVNMSATGQVFRVSVRFTYVNSLQFALILWRSSFLCAYSSAVKEFTIPTSHRESTKKTMKKHIEKRAFSRPEDVIRL